MFKNEQQQCKAIQILLGSLHLGHLWSSTGPTSLACEYLEGSPLSSGEDLVLRAAFDIWNGGGRSLFADIIQKLDEKRAFLLFSLVIATHNGAEAVEKWIAENGGTR